MASELFNMIMTGFKEIAEYRGDLELAKEIEKDRLSLNESLTEEFKEDFLEMPIEEEDPVYNCPDCGDELTFIGYQGDTVEYKCPICGEYFYDDNGKLLSAGEYDDKYYEAENESLTENEDDIDYYKKNGNGDYYIDLYVKNHPGVSHEDAAKILAADWPPNVKRRENRAKNEQLTKDALNEKIDHDLIMAMKKGGMTNIDFENSDLKEISREEALNYPSWFREDVIVVTKDGKAQYLNNLINANNKWGGRGRVRNDASKNRVLRDAVSFWAPKDLENGDHGWLINSGNGIYQREKKRGYKSDLDKDSPLHDIHRHDLSKEEKNKLFQADVRNRMKYEENESLIEALLPNGALDPKNVDKIFSSFEELGLTSDLSNQQFSDAFFEVIYNELERMNSPETENFEDGAYDFNEVYRLLDDQGKKAATDFLVAHVFTPDSPGNDDRQPAYFEEWWADGGMDDEAKRDLRELGISHSKVKTYQDEVLWRFSGSLGSFKKALSKGYFFSLYETQVDVISPNLKAYIESKNESLNEDTDRLAELNNQLKEVCTKMADLRKSGRGYGDWLYKQYDKDRLSLIKEIDAEKMGGQPITARDITKEVKALTGLSTLKTNTTGIRGFHNVGDGSFTVIKETPDTFRLSFYRNKDKQEDVKNTLISKGYNVSDFGGDLLIYYIKKNLTNESLTEDKNETLNQAIWDENNELKPEVKETLTKIADTFIKKLEEDDIPLDVEDIEIVGSNANYNYTPQSDIDLHIIADLSQFKGREKELAEKIYQCKKSIFNDKYDPIIRGFEVEIYVEPAEDKNGNEIPDEVETPVEEALNESPINGIGYNDSSDPLGDYYDSLRTRHAPSAKFNKRSKEDQALCNKYWKDYFSSANQWNVSDEDQEKAWDMARNKYRHMFDTELVFAKVMEETGDKNFAATVASMVDLLHEQ